MALTDNYYGVTLSSPQNADFSSGELIPRPSRPSRQEIEDRVAELLWEHTTKDETPEGAEEISKYVYGLLTAAWEETPAQTPAPTRPIQTYRQRMEAADVARKKFAESIKRPPLPASHPIHPSQAFKK